MFTSFGLPQSQSLSQRKSSNKYGLYGSNKPVNKMKKKPPIPGGVSAKRPKKVEQGPEMPVLSDDYLN